MKITINDNKSRRTNCGCILAIVIFNVLIGGWSVSYLLAFFFSKTIPFLGAALLGLIVGEVSIPIAVVVWLLRSFGII